MPSSGRDMLDRAAAVHRWDCPAVAAKPALAETDVAEVDAAAAAALRRPYDALRRLIGQAAGLLVLAQASQRREIVDLPAVAVARDQWREVTSTLADLKRAARLRAPERKPHLRRSPCRRLPRRAGSLGGPKRRRRSLALERIAAAYRLVQNASSHKLGMTMVDFRQSCCNCAPLTVRGS